MAVRIVRTSLVVAALVLFVSLLGCGGGGGGGVAVAPRVSDTLFAPNYIDAIYAQPSGGIFHWNHLPMRVAFTTPNNWPTADYGAPMDLYNAAANEWNQMGLQAMVVVVPQGAPADATASFTTLAQLDPQEHLRGLTQYQHNVATGEMQAATIQVALDNPDGTFAGPGIIQEAVAHEIGHALGIGGHSPNPVDLMYAIGEGQVAHPEDWNTAMSAYPSFFGRFVALEQGPTNRALSGPVHTDVIY